MQFQPQLQWQFSERVFSRSLNVDANVTDGIIAQAIFNGQEGHFGRNNGSILSFM